MPFSCSLCPDRQFVSLNALADHQRSSTRWHPYCHICNKDLKLGKRAFEQHQLQHQLGEPVEWKCEPCDRTFVKQHALSDHYRQSASHPNCPVEACGKGFRNNWVRDEHVRKEHPVTECPCGDQYYTEDQNIHFLTSPLHTACLDCDLGLLDINALEEHKEIIHEQAQCTKCTRHFRGDRQLQHHFLISTAHPKCEQCRLGFADNDQFKEHVDDKHPSPPPSVKEVAGPSPVPTTPQEHRPPTVMGSRKKTPRPQVPDLEAPSQSSRPRLNISSANVRSLWTESPLKPIWDSPIGQSPIPRLAPTSGKRSMLGTSNVLPEEKEQDDPTMVSMVDGLTLDSHEADIEFKPPPPPIKMIHPSPIAFSGPTKSLSLDTNFRASTACTSFNPLGSLAPFSPSPDTSSPNGLAVLPTMSPLASTPSEITTLGHYNAPWNLSLTPQSLSGFSSPLDEQVLQPTLHRRGSTSSLETRVDTEPNANFITLTSESNTWKLYDNAINSIISPTKSKDRASSRGSYSDSSVLVATSPDLSSISFSAADMLIMEQELEPPSKRPKPSRQGSGSTSTSRSVVYCRLCGKDPCDDCAATFCGHIFCYGCITQHVIKTPKCPMCFTPTLLYSVFRLHLS